MLPLSDTFSLFGKLGYASYDVDAHVEFRRRGQRQRDDSESDMTFGVGAALSFGQFEARGEFEAINVDGGDANMISLSGLYRF